MAEKEKKVKTEDLLIEAKSFVNYYKKEIGKSIRGGRNVIFVSFSDLSSFSHVLAEQLLSNPDELLQIIELAVEDSGLVNNPRVRLLDLPEVVKIREIRAKHLNKFINIEGIVRQSSEVRPQVINAKFECPSCGTVISVLQIEKKFREPSRCSCGRRGGFRMISKEMVDAQRIVIEESPESLVGGEQPRRISVFLKEDLVEPKMEERTTPGSRVMMLGVLKEIQIPLQTGALSVRFDFMIEANNIIPLEETFEEVETNEEDERQIKELAEDPKIFDRLAQNIAPSVYGYEELKQALVLQLFSGVKKKRSDGTDNRGDLHVLIVGDPGVAKSVLLKFMSMIAPKGRYVAGRGTSAAGLCISGDSLVQIDKGEIMEIGNKIENEICGVKADINGNFIKKANNIKTISLGSQLKLNSYNLLDYWKLPVKSKILKITTRSGREVMTTENTPLCLLKNGNLVWMPAKELCVGDRIATVRKLPEGVGSVDILDFIKLEKTKIELSSKFIKKLKNILLKKYGNLREFCKKEKLDESLLYYSLTHHRVTYKNIKKLVKAAGIQFGLRDILSISLRNGKSFNLKNINEEFMYLFGVLLGDGDIEISEKKGAVRISNSNIPLLKKIKSIIKNLFDYDTKICYQKDRVPSIRLSLKIIAELFYALGMRSPKKEIDIHYKLTALQNKKISTFLRGLFDTDGSIYVRSKGSSVIDLVTISKKLSRKIQLLLLRFGIISKIRERDKRGVYTFKNKKIITKNIQYVIEIYGIENFKKFDKYIGFWVLPKKKKLKKLILSRRIKPHLNLDVIPISSYLKEICRRYNIKSSRYWMYFNGKCNPSKNKLNELNSFLEKKGIHEENLKILIDSDIYWDEIKGVKEMHSPKWVYDFTIDNKHNFVANGIIVHNTASVVRDEFLRGWSLEAGAMVLSHRGLICIDEIEKMDVGDRSAMHEAMEQQCISISKANVQATLRSETSVLAAGNPKLGRFDPFTPIAQQIDLDPTLLNRFDFIFTLRDLPERARDEAIATHVLMEHQQPESKISIDPILFRKYVAYARQHILPKLTDAAVDEIKKFYVGLRNTPVAMESMQRPIAISPRQLEALIRISEASAKIRLSKKVTKEDAIRAINLMKFYLMQVGYDYETKTFDIDRIVTGIPTSQRNKIILVKEALSRLESRLGKLIPIEEIEKELANKINKEDIEEALDKLTISGDIFHPRKGFVQKM